MSPPPDPIAAGGIVAFGRRLRSRETTCEAAIADYLARIETLEPTVGAFEYVAADSALATARALDRLLAGGSDLGPLTGVPVAIKDLFAVAGMPTTAGSNLDVADLIGAEGRFVTSLKRAGCIVIGKTKTIEFAFGGAGGVNTVRGTPWNPWDASVHRGPGGSSSGSAAAVAAGLCAFAIGSDTGGSVRLPAALCGLFGFKPTRGRWPTDGIFPLCPTLDTIGLLTKSAADAALIFGTLTGISVPPMPSLRGARLGRPVNQFVDCLDPAIEGCFVAALEALCAAGAEVVDVDVPDLGPPEAFFHAIVPAEFLAAFGRDRFLRERAHMGADIAARAEAGLDLRADHYIDFVRRHLELRRLAHARMQGFDGWVTPTLGLVAPPVADFADTEQALEINVRIGRLTRPVNLFGFCATSTPIHQLGSDLPVGLQVMAPANAESSLLALVQAIESVVGAPSMPDLARFETSSRA